MTRSDKAENRKLFFYKPLVFENLGPVILSTHELEEAAGVPLLGQIPRFKIQKGMQQETILLNNGAAQSPAGEAFRILSANLLDLAAQALPKTDSHWWRKTSVPSVSGSFSKDRLNSVVTYVRRTEGGKDRIHRRLGKDLLRGKAILNEALSEDLPGRSAIRRRPN